MLRRPNLLRQFVCAGFATIALLAACARVGSERQSVVPGLEVRFPTPAKADTVVYERSITHAGRDSSGGTRTVVLRAIQLPVGARSLEVQQRFPGGGGEIVDTAIAELHTLRAVAHQSHQPTRTMRFAFDGNDVEGEVRAKGGDSVTHVHQALGGPIFDSNIIDLVVAALPLRTGFRAELPFFIYERGGRIPMPVAVRDRATVMFPHLGQRDAWIITVGVPGAPATIWVDTKTRAVLRVRYDISARAISFTDERVTPLGA
ncbi:MAG TPA: hypothetical protein VFT29_16045 [Gemmatimonadaceae bacterium]|nr:hypothetical protein [Gemmatimonadaceae bacterium]